MTADEMAAACERMQLERALRTPEEIAREAQLDEVDDAVHELALAADVVASCSTRWAMREAMPRLLASLRRAGLHVDGCEVMRDLLLEITDETTTTRTGTRR